MAARMDNLAAPGDLLHKAPRARSEAHLRHLLAEFLEHYHQERPHQGRDNVPLTCTTSPPVSEPLSPRQVGCRQRLGGLLNYYYREAG